MRGMKCFPNGASIGHFIIAQGEFIYKQLQGLDQPPFSELPVLIALKDECGKQLILETQDISSAGALKIASEPGSPGFSENESDSYSLPAEENEDLKPAKLLNEEEQWRGMQQKKNKHSSCLSNRYYIKIMRIRLPIIIHCQHLTRLVTKKQMNMLYLIVDLCHVTLIDLPRHVLHNLALYNSDSRLRATAYGTM